MTIDHFKREKIDSLAYFTIIGAKGQLFILDAIVRMHVCMHVRDS